MKISSIYLFLIVIAFSSKAQQNQLQPFSPSGAEMERAYSQAGQLDSALRKVAVNNEIIPFWNADGHSFWYKRNLADRNWEFIYADIIESVHKPAFDHTRVATIANKFFDKVQEATKLKFDRLIFGNSGTLLTLKLNGKWLEINLDDYSFKQAKDTSFVNYDPRKPLQRKRSRWEGTPSRFLSPDGKNVLSLKAGNLFVTDTESKAETQLTTDGTEKRPYAEFSWSPDSKNVIGYLVNPKKIDSVYYVLSAVTGTTRGQLKSHEYAQPGDAFTSYEPFIFNIATKKIIKVDTEHIDFFEPQPLHWRNNDNRYYLYEKVDRGHQRFRVIEVDVQTGKTRNIIDEKAKTFIYEDRIYTRYLPKTNEVIWTSEQDGYRHIYLVNILTGKQFQVTKGDFVVRDIDSVDVEKREIWFTASGVNKKEDPYFLHQYRVNFNGKNRIALNLEQGNHRVVFSPDRNYYVDTYSQINVAPVTVVKRTADAKSIMELERGTTTGFTEAGLKLPEVFVAKGRDAKTDIWGVVWRPSKMDNSKTYPVIEYIYAGPQDSFVPKNFTPYSEMQSLAELGFIVVQMDGMGTANRSKAFHDVCWKNLADAGFPDRILWIKAMAQKYPNADISRVGIYGTSAGGQNSTGALLFHPEFYKAAVSACGCHDNRIDKQWWNEQWMGYPVGPHYDEQSNITNAAKLQGDLFLIVGEADENVPPESTYRLADALIKANKDFELLSIPGMGHSDGGAYGRRRKRDFFVKHLLHAEPPKRNVVIN